MLFKTGSVSKIATSEDEKQKSTECYMVFSTTHNTIFPIKDLIKGEFDQQFVGNDNVPSSEFNRYPIYATKEEAIDNSSQLSLMPQCVYIVEMGADSTEIKHAAAQGKLSQFIVKAFSRHDLITQKQPTAIVNPNYNSPKLQQQVSALSSTSLIEKCNSPIQNKEKKQQESSSPDSSKSLMLSSSREK